MKKKLWRHTKNIRTEKVAQVKIQEQNEREYEKNDDVIWQNLARKNLALMKNYEGNVSYKMQKWLKWKIENRKC